MAHSVITPRNHPFASLLYLEWGLLVLAIAMELFGPLRGILTRSPLLPIAPIIAFGIMGLWLPTQNTLMKWLHLSSQIGLIMLGTFGFIGHIFPFPHLIMVFRSSLMFGLGGRLSVAAIAFALFIVIIIQRLQSIGQRLSMPTISALDIETFSQRMFITFSITFSILFALSLLMILLLMNALLTERQSREKLVQANNQLRDYALRVESLAMEQERNRIARDIHDSLGHVLTALNLQIEGAVKLATLRPEESQRFLKEAKRLGSTALNEVRQSVSTMRTNPLQDQTLADAIATLTEDFQRTSQIQPQVNIQLAIPLSIEVATTLYRIVQEALTNIYKHAEATAVAIQLHTDDTAVYLVIADNGKGFDRTVSQRSGFGFTGMQERITVLNGILNIDSQPGEGCQITVKLPTT